MDCFKCKGRLKPAKTNTGMEFDWCTLCKGIWTPKEALLKIFKSHSAIEKMISEGLTRAKTVSYDCPDCQKPIVNGKVLDSEIIIETCRACEKYFFDEKELKLLLDHIQGSDLPKGEDIDWSKEELVQADEKCPICEDQHLFGFKGRLDRLEVCLKCNGMATQVKHLEKLAERSLFGPTMFEFRSGAELVVYCRFCSFAQEKKNKSCVKCDREIKAVNCNSCGSRMAEYQLDDVLIDRCQICNWVWLDSGEFEKVMTVMPDVTRQIERLKLKDQLRNVKMDAVSEAYSLSIERSRRHMLNNIWGGAAILFY